MKTETEEEAISEKDTDLYILINFLESKVSCILMEGDCGHFTDAVI